MDARKHIQFWSCLKSFPKHLLSFSLSLFPGDSDSDLIRGAPQGTKLVALLFWRVINYVLLELKRDSNTWMTSPCFWNTSQSNEKCIPNSVMRSGFQLNKNKPKGWVQSPKAKPPVSWIMDWYCRTFFYIMGLTFIGDCSSIGADTSLGEKGNRPVSLLISFARMGFSQPQLRIEFAHHECY